MNLSRVDKNSIWLIVSRFASQGLAVLFTILLAQRLGVAGFGGYAFIAAVVFICNTLTTFGTDMLLIREIAAKDDFSNLSSALLIQLALSGVCIAAIWLGGSYIPNQSTEVLVALRIYCLCLIPLAFFTIFTIVLRGKQRMDAYMLLNFSIASLQVIVVLIMMKPHSDVITASLGMLIVQVVVTTLAGMICFKLFPELRSLWKFDLTHGWLLIKAAAPIAWLALLGMIYQKLSITMLSTMDGSTEAGIFSAASRAVEASKTIHLAIFVALYPAIAQGLATAHEGYTKTETSYFRLLLVGALGAALGLSLFAPFIVRLLYGSEFAPSVHTLKILAWTLIPFSTSSFLSLALVARYKERLIGVIMTISVLVLIMLNLWLIPIQGSSGAAWAFLITEYIQAGLMMIAGIPFYSMQRATHELSELS